jgi:hypothetical protein
MPTGEHHEVLIGNPSTALEASRRQEYCAIQRNMLVTVAAAATDPAADEQPPSEEQVWTLIGHARRLVSPSFAAWLQVAAFSGLRRGELDALRRARVDLARARIEVVEQFDAKTRTFTLPKNGRRREAH